MFFFFFQAEDGIRDYKVTGVQTCALPISRPLWMRSLQKVHLLARPVSWLNDTTPNGHELTQYRQPLHTSWLMFTVPYSVRWIAPVGHASRQPAWAQCLQTSDIRSHCSSPFACGFSMKRTRR